MPYLMVGFFFPFSFFFVFFVFFVSSLVFDLKKKIVFTFFSGKLYSIMQTWRGFYRSLLNDGLMVPTGLLGVPN